MRISNKRIRIAMIEHDIKQFQLAKIMGCHEGHVSRLLRDELPDEEQDRIINIIRNNAKKED